MSNQNFTISANHTTIRKKKNESSGTKLLTPAYFSPHYTRISNGGVRQEEFCVPDKKYEMSGGKYTIQKKENNSSSAVLLTPAYFDRYYLQLSDSNGEKREGEKQEEFYLPNIVEPCKNCENMCYITEHTIVQTTCYCTEIVPENYLSFIPSTDDIYRKI